MSFSFISKKYLKIVPNCQSETQSIGPMRNRELDCKHTYGACVLHRVTIDDKTTPAATQVLALRTCTYVHSSFPFLLTCDFDVAAGIAAVQYR